MDEIRVIGFVWYVGDELNLTGEEKVQAATAGITVDLDSLSLRCDEETTLLALCIGAKEGCRHELTDFNDPFVKKYGLTETDYSIILWEMSIQEIKNGLSQQYSKQFEWGDESFMDYFSEGVSLQSI